MQETWPATESGDRQRSQSPGSPKEAKKLPKKSIGLFKEGRGSRKELPSGIMCYHTQNCEKCGIVKPSRGDKNQ